jgi:hypothetical protein
LPDTAGSTTAIECTPPTTALSRSRAARLRERVPCLIIVLKIKVAMSNAPVNHRDENFWHYRRCDACSPKPNP